ncbi:MAG: methyltransferase domain-containing protein [Porticoccaceae bacterium]|nr:methyltransferase domain-containing protein [Porticoccaceae bacterium]
MKAVILSFMMALPVWAAQPALTEADRAALQAALQHPNRPAQDKAADDNRKPAQLLAFFGIKKGMQVADMMSGRGYYAEILSRYLGPDATVYAQNNSIALGRFADKAMNKRLNGRDLDNVVRLDRELEEPGFPVAKLDAVLLGLFYHDSYWMKADRHKMNRAIYDSLKPGGVFALWDHRAEPGSGHRDVQTLHRVDEALVIKEVVAAGFVLEASTELLANPEDNHTINVFDPQIRGETDRFVLRFRKP